MKKMSKTVLLTSLLLSISIILGNKIVFEGKVYGNNYFLENFSILDFIIGVFVFIISYIFIIFLTKFYKNKTEKIFDLKENKKDNFLFLFISFIILFLIFMIYFFTYFPGGLWADTFSSQLMIQKHLPFTNHHPVLYTLSLYIVTLFSPNLNLGYAVHTLIQIFLMIFLMIYFANWLLKKNVNRKIVIFVIAFFALFKLNHLYSVSIWKDTPFSIILFFYTLAFTDLQFEFLNLDFKKYSILKFNILSVLVIFLRNNGIFIVTISLILLLLINIKKISKKKSILSNFLVILISFVIIRCYPLFGIQKNSCVESLAIPIQQISSVVANDGNISAEQKDKISLVLPIDNIKKSFKPLIVDPIKWNYNFNTTYLEEHLGEYFKLYIELFLQNPKEYIKAYLLQTSGFWSFTVNGDEAYENRLKFHEILSRAGQIDIINQITGFSLDSILAPLVYISGGFFFWIHFISATITAQIANKKYLLGYLPLFILWGTVMIATPMGTALRYIYGLVITLPFTILYPFLASHYTITNNINNPKI